VDVIAPSPHPRSRSAHAMGFGFGFGRGGRGFKRVSSGGGGFDPTTLGPTELCRADGSEYNGAPWAAEYGSGLNELTNPPPVSAAVNGYTGADFDGTNDRLDTGDDFSGYVTATAGTILVLFNADTGATPSASAYDDPSLVSDLLNCFNLGFTSSGLGLAFYDGVGWIEPTKVTCSTGALHVAMCRWNASTVEISVDGGTPSSIAHAGSLAIVSSAGYHFTVGHAEISASTFFDGKVYEVWAFNKRLTDTDIANYMTYVAARYNHTF